jgi:hypothetical protein
VATTSNGNLITQITHIPRAVIFFGLAKMVTSSINRLNKKNSAENI